MNDVIDLLRDILSELKDLNAKIDRLEDIDSAISEASTDICREIDSLRGGTYDLSDIYSKIDDIADRME